MARAASELRWALGGLGLALLAFGTSGQVLKDSARAEPLRVGVAPPLRVVTTSEGLRWSGRVQPGELAGRMTARVDGAAVTAEVVEDLLHVDLAGAGPGHHLIELTLDQQGGRSQTVTDAVLVGPFAMAWEEPCALRLTISAGAIDRLVMPVVRERLLAAARATELLGAETTLERAEVTLLDDGVRVRVAVAGFNRVAVDAVFAARPSGSRGLALSLERLGPVEFTGALRTKATVGGAAIGGVAVGAALSGPLAPIAALGGYVLADSLVSRRARQEVEGRIRGGLALVSGAELLPEQAELLVGEPRSAAALAFCGPLTISAGVGISAGFSLRPVDVGAGGVHVVTIAGDVIAGEGEVGVSPGPVVQGVVLPGPGDMVTDDDVRVDLSIDAVNGVVDAWTRSGLLAERVRAAGWVPRVDEQLHEWTRLALAGISLARAPVVMPAGDRWALSFSGLRLDLRGGEATGAVLAAGRGFIRPQFHAETGVLELGGAVDRLRLTCVDGHLLAPCFGALLELGEVETRLDEALAPGTGRLPGLDVRGLLRAHTRGFKSSGGFDVAALAVTVPPALPGVLRVTARLQ
jgi:hypothetical protein